MQLEVLYVPAIYGASALTTIMKVYIPTKRRRYNGIAVGKDHRRPKTPQFRSWVFVDT